MKKGEFMKGLKESIDFLQRVYERAEKEPASRIKEYEVKVFAITPYLESKIFIAKAILDYETD